jgi:formamidopyrimidine-DNA glycosylase
MPELPEVETVKNELLPHVIGRSISHITLLWEGILRQPSPIEFHNRTAGQRVVGLSRRGKYLVFSLQSGDFLILHLKMSGSLIMAGDTPPLKYTRAMIHLDNEHNILFLDPRKFGTMQLVGESGQVLGELGPEPLEPGFTVEQLVKRLGRRQAPIKAVLLDQSLIAGVGNMYADEALFLAGIHPLTPAGSLSLAEVRQLYNGIRQVLQEAIIKKGASISNYLRPGGQPGTAQISFKVAHRGGQSCPTCGSSIERIPIRNRGSYFCPHCQPNRISAGQIGN